MVDTSKFDASGRAAVKILRAAPKVAPPRPTRAEAEEAVRTLLAWSGDDPGREGLIDTPQRVTEAFEEYFKGYDMDPKVALATTFEDVGGYEDMVLLRDIRVESHCEHHIAPFIGVAHIAYMPKGKVVGLSKIARLVEVFGKRLQTQERLSAEILSALVANLEPKGAAILISAEHQCMSTRGVHQPGVATITTGFSGVFSTDNNLQDRFLQLVAQPSGLRR